MKNCPYCGEENLDNAATCYYCGRDLPASAPGDVEPTQPNRAYRPDAPPAAGPQDTPGQAARSYPQADPGGYTQPGQYGGTYGQPPQQPLPPQTGYTQPYSTQPQPPYPAQPYPQQQPASYPPGGAYPPGGTYPPAAPPARSPMWALTALLAGVLLCVCLVAVWAVLDTTNRGMARLGDQIATRAAGIFAPAPSETPSFAEQPPPEIPSPWPTFTPEPPAATAETPVSPNDPTPPPETPIPGENSDYVDKLLSPECRAALEQLSQMTGQLSSEPLKLLDEAWRNDFNLARANLTTYCGTLDAASPVPGQVEAAHQALTRANAEFDLANQLFQEAVDGRNPAKFLEAAQHFGSAASNLGTALAEIRKLVE